MDINMYIFILSVVAPQNPAESGLSQCETKFCHSLFPKPHSLCKQGKQQEDKETWNGSTETIISNIMWISQWLMHIIDGDPYMSKSSQERKDYPVAWANHEDWLLFLILNPWTHREAWTFLIVTSVIHALGNESQKLRWQFLSWNIPVC